MPTSEKDQRVDAGSGNIFPRLFNQIKSCPERAPTYGGNTDLQLFVVEAGVFSLGDHPELAAHLLRYAERLEEVARLHLRISLAQWWENINKEGFRNEVGTQEFDYVAQSLGSMVERQSSRSRLEKLFEEEREGDGGAGRAGQTDNQEEARKYTVGVSKMEKRKVDVENLLANPKRAKVYRSEPEVQRAIAMRIASRVLRDGVDYSLARATVQYVARLGADAQKDFALIALSPGGRLAQNGILAALERDEPAFTVLNKWVEEEMKELEAEMETVDQENNALRSSRRGR